MRVLLLHPEDSPRRGEWSGQRWDLVVDLGKSSEFSAATWSEQFRCPVLRSELFRCGVEDLKLVRRLLSAGGGKLLDEEGIDWWKLTLLLIAPHVETALILQRLAAQISYKADIWATRAGWPVDALLFLLGHQVKNFSSNSLTRLCGRAAQYGRLCRRFSAAQIKEIFLDKYDAGYEWRSRFVSRRTAQTEPVILVPSAYGNASWMAASYARQLPDQNFLLVATRRSGKQFKPAPNMSLSDLTSYAGTDSTESECAGILKEWRSLRAELCATQEFEVLAHAGILEEFPNWFRSGLKVRNAWRKVLDSEPITGVLCADDSNRYTRLPVLLASQRGIPTVDFHHGALDGRYLLKEMPCDVYLAKNAMEHDYLVRVCGLPPEKVMIGAPSPAYAVSPRSPKPPRGSSVIFFSEPYEVVGMRAEEVYREILPPLCRLARDSGRSLVIKLHPFESRSERKPIVRSVLSKSDLRCVTVVDGPLSGQLLSSAWFGVTVESTTVIDCVMAGVPCFLVNWLTLSSYGYARQYARFGIGDILTSAKDIEQIPWRLNDFNTRATRQRSVWKTIDPEMLRKWLSTGSAVQAVQAIAERVS